MTLSTDCATKVCFPQSRSTGKERDTKSISNSLPGLKIETGGTHILIKLAA